MKGTCRSEAFGLSASDDRQIDILMVPGRDLDAVKRSLPTTTLRAIIRIDEGLSKS